MKYSLIFVLSLLFLVSCGNNDDDNNRFLNGVNAYGQPCTLNQVNGYNNYNNFNNNYQYGAYNPYQLEMARRCGYSINNNFNNGYNNGYNGVNNSGCYVPQDLQGIADYDYIDAEMIADMNFEIENELRDVHGIVQPQTEDDVQAYYTQVGFSAGVYTGGGYGYGGNPYGYGGYGGNQFGYCDQINQ